MIKKILAEYGWCMWLGFALGIINVSVFDWHWFLVVVPTCLLVSIRDAYKEKI